MKPLLRPRKKFTGKLAKPVNIDGNEQEVRQELVEKISLLFQHYSITTPVDEKTEIESWYRLAIELAFDFVPGLQFVEPKKRGRKTDSITPLMLVVDVDEVRAKRKCSVREAIRLLVSRTGEAQPWRGRNKGTLQNRYGKAVRSEGLGLRLVRGREPEVKKVSR